MSYFIFSLKKIVKNKLTWIPLLIVFFICLFVLFQNNVAQKRYNLGEQIRNNIQTNQLLIEESKRKSQDLDKNSEKYRLLQQTISESEKIMENDKEWLSAYNNKDWKKVYKNKLFHLKRAIEFSQGREDKTLLNALNREQKLYQSLQKKNIPFEDSTYPITGFQFTMSLFTYFFPVLFVLINIFILGQLYTSNFYNKMHLSTLLPMRPLHEIFIQLGVGICFVFCSFLLVVGLLFMISSTLFGFGSLDYPVIYYFLGTQDFYFSSIGPAIIPTIVLFLVANISIVSIIYTISYILRDKMMTLFISTLVLIGGVILPYFVQPIQKLSHLLPTTYLHSYQVVCGELQMKIDNTSVQFWLGMCMSFIYILVNYLLCYIVYLYRNQKMIRYERENNQ